MPRFTRYIRAFFLALRMTLRGEKPAIPPPPPMLIWAREMNMLVEEVYTVVEAGGLDAAARRSIIVRVDGRDTSAETLLAGLKYQSGTEFPYLLTHPHKQNIVAIQAANINNVYWVSRLKAAAALQSPGIQHSLNRLADHLERMPAAPESE